MNILIYICKSKKPSIKITVQIVSFQYNSIVFNFRNLRVIIVYFTKILVAICREFIFIQKIYKYSIVMEFRFKYRKPLIYYITLKEERH